MREIIPLKKRPVDIPIVAFFIVNLLIITYSVDLEQLVIKDPAAFNYPVWPLPFMIDLVHWWGKTFDPLLMARPVWWKATIWIDVIFFGPYYAVGLYAFIKGKEWIRIPSIIYSAVLFTNVTIICSEEIWGPHAGARLGIVLLANLCWFLFPIYITWRMWKSPHPFTKEAGN